MVFSLYYKHAIQDNNFHLFWHRYCFFNRGGSISIDKTGTVTVFDPEGRGTSLGVIELYTFPNPAGLSSLGHNLYRPTDASGEAISGTPGSDGVGTIAQGFLEMSNVDVVEEMVSMIMAQKAHEINSKAIQTADNILQIANNIDR